MRRYASIIIVGTAACALLFVLTRSRSVRTIVAGVGTDALPPEAEQAMTPRPEPDETPLPDPLIDPRVEIHKEARVLTVFSGSQPVKDYRMVLGSTPVGDKEREGDGRTPEGEFYVCSKNDASQYHRSIGLSYPNAEDADRGLTAGFISKREHRTILEAIRHMKQPPWNTALGGEIMIHGGGTRADWTAGCIALSDADAEELFNALPLGTTVIIEP